MTTGETFGYFLVRDTNTQPLPLPGLDSDRIAVVRGPPGLEQTYWASLHAGGGGVGIVADGVWNPLNGATVALGSDAVTVSGAAFTAADIGKRFTMLRGGSPVFFAGSRLANPINPGTNYRAGDTIFVAGAPADVWAVGAVSVPSTPVSGGSGGPPSRTFNVRGVFPGFDGRRKSCRLEVTTNAAGQVITVNRIAKAGMYTNPAFTGINASFDSHDWPGLTGLVITITLGVMQIRRKAACFYGRITGATLTVEEMIYGTIVAGDSFAGIEVIEGTTITAFGTGTGGLGTYTLSTAHTDMNNNVWLFVSETPVTTTTPPDGNVSPTGGSGTGLLINPEWRGIPLVGNIIAVLSPTQVQLDVTAASRATNVGYCYGTDYGPTIQAALDAEQQVRLPAGIICHSNQLQFKTNSYITGLGAALGSDPLTALAYVGPRSSRGFQLSGDKVVTGTVDIDGCAIGGFTLLGNNLIGGALYECGVIGSEHLPIQTRGHTYIAVQFTGGFNKANINNIHSTLIVRETDSPGWDVTGVYIGPGVQYSDADDPGVNDTCRTLYPFWLVDVDLEGFGRPVWYRVADSNSHGYVKCRGPDDLPGIEFGGHDTLTRFARAIHFSYLDPTNCLLRGGVYPANVVVSNYNFLNGSSLADVEGTTEAAEAIEEDDPGIRTEFGARFFGISNQGTLMAPRLQPYQFNNRQEPKQNSWMLYPITDANTDVPGAEITGSGNFSVLAYTDTNETLRVLQPQPAIASLTILSTSSPTASAGAGTNTIRAMVASGNLLYVVSSVSAGSTYLHVLDISNPAAPLELSETVVGAGQAIGQAQLAGSYLFIPVNDAVTSIRVVDVSDAWAPSLVATIATGSNGAGALAVAGNVLFAGLRNSGVLRAYGLAALPGVPPQIGTLSLAGADLINHIVIRGKYAYVAENNATDTNLGLQIVDVSNPAAMVLAGSYDASQGAAGDYDCRGLAVSGAYAYTVVVIGSTAALHVVNVANPTAPANAAVLPITQPPTAAGNTLLAIGDWLYLTQVFGGNDLIRYDISNPLAPTLAQSVSLGVGNDGGVMAVSGNLLFVDTTTTADNLKILSIPGPTQPAGVFGSLQADRVRLEHLDVDRDVRFNGGLSIGNQGLYSKGLIAGPATQTRVYTVGTLPAGRLGMRAMVSDAAAPAFLAAPVGGGAVRAPVFWDDGGSAWKVG